MQIGVVGDSHGNIDYLLEAVNFLRDKLAIDKIYHVGDNYTDGNALAKRGWHYLIVPGIYEPEYNDPNIPNYIIDRVDGFRIFLAHSLEDAKLNSKKIKDCKIVCYGHTHKPDVKLENGQLFINPGHLKDKIDKGQEASFGVLIIDSFIMKVKIYNMNKKVIIEEKFLCF